MNAFVSGGSRGIGRGIVLELARAGYGVAFTYVSNEKEAAETLRLANGLAPDVMVKSYKLNQSSSAECEQVVDQAIEDFDDIAILVNNAAINRNNAVALMSDEEWNDVISTNLSGPFYLTRQFLLPMLSQRFGRIINISSLSAGGSSGQVSYAASKAGLHALTQTVAKEYGPKGITANVIVVGYVPTSLTEEQMSKELHEFWLTYCPAKRVGTVEEIAGAVRYLCSENAGFINGEIIKITGGLSYAP